MEIFIVKCISVITDQGDHNTDDEQLGIFTTQELAEEFVATLPRVIGDNYWFDYNENINRPFDIMLASYTITPVEVNVGKMPWGMISSETEDEIVAYLADSDNY